MILFSSSIETNIEEVLGLSDLSGVPNTFLTEIKQDQVYQTIYQELQKKIPKQNSISSPLPIDGAHEHDESKPISPRLLSLEYGADDDIIDNETNINDDILSTASSEHNDSSQDGYDTDLETGETFILFFQSINSFFQIEVIVHDNHDITGKTQYREACVQSKLIPCSYFMAHIQDREMVLRYHQFSTEDIRTIAKALCVRRKFFSFVI